MAAVTCSMKNAPFSKFHIRSLATIHIWGKQRNTKHLQDTRDPSGREKEIELRKCCAKVEYVKAVNADMQPFM